MVLISEHSHFGELKQWKVTLSVGFILPRQRLVIWESGRGEVLVQTQAKEHFNDELAGAVCQHIVPAPLHGYTQVLQLAYTCL